VIDGPPASSGRGLRLRFACRTEFPGLNQRVSEGRIGLGHRANAVSFDGKQALKTGRARARRRPPKQHERCRSRPIDGQHRRRDRRQLNGDSGSLRLRDH